MAGIFVGEVVSRLSRLRQRRGSNASLGARSNSTDADSQHWDLASLESDEETSQHTRKARITRRRSVETHVYTKKCLT